MDPSLWVESTGIRKDIVVARDEVRRTAHWSLSAVLAMFYCANQLFAGRYLLLEGEYGLCIGVFLLALLEEAVQ
jgi:hypothetical protein